MNQESLKNAEKDINLHNYDEEKPITLFDLLHAVWQGKRLMVLCIFIFTFIAFVYSISRPNIYKASALLSPSGVQVGSGVGQISEQLGGIVTLAGLDLDGRRDSKITLALEVLNSRKFVSNFIEKHDILVSLMAAVDWDINKNALILDENIYDIESERWLRKPKGLRRAKPSYQEACEVFVNNFYSITENKISGTYTLSIMHYSPYLAQNWVSWLIEDINEAMREMKKAEVKQSLDYLNTQLNKTHIAEVKSTLYELIDEKTKMLMLVELQKDYIFKVIDPAVVPEFKLKPHRVLICLGGMVSGGVIGLSLIFIGFVLKKDRVKLNERNIERPPEF